MVDQLVAPPSRLTQLDEPTRALLGLAVAIALGQEERLNRASRDCLARAVPPRWVDELLLQSVLMVGWPRALLAAGIWRELAGPASSPLPEEDPGTDYARAAEWRARGEALCRLIYGGNYQRLRDNVRALHPALEVWMLTEGYGRTLGRPGLDPARRELCTVVQVAVQGAERQLHSHLQGALHAGAEVSAIEEALLLVRPALGPETVSVTAAVWGRVKP